MSNQEIILDDEDVKKAERNENEFHKYVWEADVLTPEECQILIDYAHKKEDELLEELSEEETDLDKYWYESLTSIHHHRYNIFEDHPWLADKLSHILTFGPTKDFLEWPIMVQGWVNIYRKGKGIDWHLHQGLIGKSFTANIFLGGPTNPGVLYKPFNKKPIIRENSPGKMHLLPCDLFHKAPKNVSDDELRYTCGISIHSFDLINKDNLNRNAFNTRKGNKECVILTNEHWL